jgi:hypothetical protein
MRNNRWPKMQYSQAVALCEISASFPVQEDDRLCLFDEVSGLDRFGPPTSIGLSICGHTCKAYSGTRIVFLAGRP